MTYTSAPRPLACPGCLALPDAGVSQPVAAQGETLLLSLPQIHCAACIRSVETSLMGHRDVRAARVNLNRKQVRITARPDTTPETLIAHLATKGHEAHLLDAATLGTNADERGRALLLRVAIAGFAMMNVMLMSVAVWSGAGEATRTLFHWLSAAIALPAVGFAGQPFFTQALTALRARRLNMDVPISLALILACGMSLYETAVGGHTAYFDAALSLTFFLLAGRYLDHRCRASARSAAQELAALEVPRVLRLENGKQQTVDLAQCQVGDHLVVLPGARIPVDGIVTDGRSDIDRSLLTGESLPIPVAPDSPLQAGEMNLGGKLTLRATAVGDKTTLRQMVTMIDAAESARNRYTALADRAAALYAPLVHVLAFAAFLFWVFYASDPRLALNVAIATLIITCPCALGLAVPAVSTAAAGRLFRQGLLVKNGTALERIAHTDTVVFDKTGTLTAGQLDVASTNSLPDAHRGVASALAGVSTHPVARALALGLQPAMPAPLTDAREHTGQGISAKWNGTEVRLGSADFTGARPNDQHGAWLRIGETAPHFLALTARLRPGAKEAVAALMAMGLDVHLLSGDSDSATREVAATLGICHATGQQRPSDKIDYLNTLAEQGHQVLMVGDGLNDTGALAAAAASVAPASAADAARAASDVVLLGQNLEGLPELVSTARSARRRILENFAIAAGYNAFVIPFAVAGFVTPLLAAIAMSTSSITVLLNALRLTRKARP